MRIVLSKETPADISVYGYEEPFTAEEFEEIQKENEEYSSRMKEKKEEWQKRKREDDRKK